MAAEHDLRLFFNEKLNCWHGLGDPPVVCDDRSIEGNVEVAPNEGSLVRHLDVPHCFLA